MKFLITAGPTREPLDPVRYLSNRSSGKMGYAIAAAALEEKHEVVLVSGPVALAAPSGAELIAVISGEEMFRAVSNHFARSDIFVMCAAVCDYKPVRPAPQKMKKQSGPFSLQLEPTKDILASLTNAPHDCFVVGFAAETEELEEKAARKLAAKQCDLLIANDVSRTDRGINSDENEAVLFFKSGARQKLARAKKTELARSLLKIILQTRENCLTKKS